VSILFLAFCNLSKSEEFDVTPKVILVETSRRMMGSLMLPEGSPWCGGKPTYFVSGHHNPESFNCEVSPGVFERVVTGKFERIDRHGCSSLDVDNDGIIDIMCSRGGSKGTGTEGYNEVHLTNEDGSIEQIFDHGLESPTRRSKDFVVFKGRDGEDLVFETVNGYPREDGMTNNNQMYKMVPQLQNGAYFQPIKGPWDDQSLYPLVVVTGKFDNDDALDIFLFGRHLIDSLTEPGKQVSQNTVQIYRQGNKSGLFAQASLREIGRADAVYEFSQATAEDFNDDGLHDIVFYDDITKKFYIMWNKTRGVGRKKIKFFRRTLHHKGDYDGKNFIVNGIRAIDVNGDGLMDIYVSQSRNDEGEYCDTKVKGGYPAVVEKFGIDKDNVFDFEPPIDPIPDLLFIQQATNKAYPTFRVHELNLGLRGCAGPELRPFGNQRLAVPYSHLQYPGYLYLLDWSGDSLPDTE